MADITRREKQIGVGGPVITPLARKYVRQVLKSGRLTYGPFLQQFEREFAKIHRRKFAVSSNSGTSSLKVAVHALKELDGWRDGEEVLVPALTFVATANVVLLNNLRPVFVDIDPRTYNIDPQKIEAKITKRTKAIMPVHVCGLPADMIAIMDIAKKNNLRVIEDSCETMFVKRDGHIVGSLGDIACFSTYAAHILTTGVGGLALTNDPAIATKMRSLVNHGRDSIYIAMDDDKGKKGKTLKEIIQKRFLFQSVGYSHRLTEFEGALGLAGLRDWKKNIHTRQSYAKRIIAGLAPYAEHLQLPHTPPKAEHAFMMFPIVVKKRDFSVDALVEWLEEKHNIETRPLLPLLNQPIYKKLFGDIEKQYPVAESVRKNAFYIGCHPQMSSADVTYILAVFKQFFKSQGLA